MATTETPSEQPTVQPVTLNESIATQLGHNVGETIKVTKVTKTYFRVNWIGNRSGTIVRSGFYRVLQQNDKLVISNIGESDKLSIKDQL